MTIGSEFFEWLELLFGTERSGRKQSTLIGTPKEEGIEDTIGVMCFGLRMFLGIFAWMDLDWEIQSLCSPLKGVRGSEKEEFLGLGKEEKDL